MAINYILQEDGTGVILQEDGDKVLAEDSTVDKAGAIFKMWSPYGVNILSSGTTFCGAGG